MSVQAVAQQMGLSLDENFKARQVNPERDIVLFDVVLVMDKFTAADLLREVRFDYGGSIMSANPLFSCICTSFTLPERVVAV